MSHWLETAKETLLIAWVTAILLGLLMYWRESKRAGDYSHPRYRIIVRYLLQIVGFGAVFSIIGVLQRVNDAGLIADSLKWFLIAMTLLLSLTQHLLGYYALPATKGAPRKGVPPESAA